MGKVDFILLASRDYKIEIDGISGGFEGDIALDDFNFADGACEKGVVYICIEIFILKIYL